MNFPKIPNLPSVPNVSNIIPKITPPLVTNLTQEIPTEIKKAADISFEVLNEVSKTIPDITSNSTFQTITNFIPSTDELLSTIFNKFLAEYNLTENAAYVLIVLSLVFIAVIPGIAATFYSEYLNINLFYSYLIVFIIVGSSILSYKLLEEEKRNNFLIFNAIVTSLITLNAVYVAAFFPNQC
jgi:hypothetical protein